ncbi:MAG TPA: DUF998 domain-containing protein [Dyella sp.]|uniref:DUF998 domain-containing protein n=1 Tax=Dyella sp. TaxID=1869338 RepID=UPI002F9224FC
MQGSKTPHLGTIAMTGIAAFVLTSLFAQFLRSDLNWARVPNSFYLIGPYGEMVQAGYVAMSVALILLAVGGYVALSAPARSAAPALLFVAGGAALTVTAMAHTDVMGRPPTLQGYVHGIAAQTAFLSTTVAMMLQAWRLRGDPNWRRWFKPAFSYAAVCFLLMWVQAFWRELPRGASQKLLIVLIAGWLMLAAYRLYRGPDSMRPL